MDEIDQKAAFGNNCERWAPDAMKKNDAIQLSGKRSRWKTFLHWLPFYLMGLPGLVYLFINNYIPMAGLQIAFKNFSYSKGMWASKWVGFKNFAFTMLFNGGLVPTYIMYVSTFHIKNTIFGLIVPNLLLSGFMVMLVRNYFENSIPRDLYEAARIDGASEFQTFFKVALPLSTPILATVGLMMGIAYWNDWQNGLYYLNDTGKHLYTIQNILNNINENINFLATNATVGVSLSSLPTTTVRMAIAVVGVLPILIIYPFFQKYFAKGITMGAVKG